MAYKHVIKVSNVRQLLNKNWYPEPNSPKWGIDVVKNSDGTITLNGTATNSGALYPIQDIPLIKNHKYYIFANQAGSFENVVFTVNNLGSSDVTQGNIWTYTRDNATELAYFWVTSGTVINNRVYKPQLFDLTEMYGGGNEPTTVEQFREKFPDEMYPYSPLINLSSNKRMIKLNSVCQLYAKNIWQEYTDLYGVSIKNNNDGSITLNGAATQTFFYTNRLDYEIKPNHKYLYFDYYPQTPSWDTYVGGCEGKVNHESDVMFAIYNLKNDGTINPSSPTLPSNTLLNTFCMCYKGFTFNNITVKPQLFDLTEMFGAGHEPATVAEFRQRFPNEYYPYSPQCWLTSYKSAVVCKTKNLFDVNNAVPYTFTNDNPPSSRISLKDGIYTTTYNNYNVGSGLRIKDGLVLSPGTYTLSLNVITVGETTPITGLTYGFRLYKSDGTKPVITTYTEKFNSRCSHAFTIPADCTDIRLYLAPHCNSGQDYVYISLKDIQLEQGSTATSYVPYQHL